MDVLPKAITVRRGQWSAEALAQLAQAENFDTSGGLESVALYANIGVPVFELIDEAGQVIGRYCLEVLKGADGVCNVQIVAAAGHADGIDLTGVIVNAAEQQARALGAHWLSFHTARPGLVRKVLRGGFAQHGVIMRKRLKGAH
jgi:hypothetical protein